MSKYTRLIHDYGICNFCGNPIELDERAIFIRRIVDYETLIVHEECYQDVQEG